MVSTRKKTGATRVERGPSFEKRLIVVMVFVVCAFLAIAVRLYMLQIRDGLANAAEAAPVSGVSIAARGDVYLHDPKAPNGLFPAAINKTLYTVFADTVALRAAGQKKGGAMEGRDELAIIDDAVRKLAPIVALDEAVLREKLSAENDPFVPLRAKATDEVVRKIKALNIAGIAFQDETLRYYPERSASHVLGFLGAGDGGKGVGKYGIEGYMDEELRGDTDVELTIDRNIQFVVCEKLHQAVARHSADGGVVVVMEPKSGAILAMCGMPDFDPNEYAKTENISSFNNPAIFAPYEPGSIFKPFTMAAAIDAGAIGPNTTYTDEGEIKIGPYTIRNSDKKSNGLQTMAQVLEKSLNTGTVFAQRSIGTEKFRDYVKAFGFGVRSGIELQTESAGDVSQLDKKGDIFAATGSYGQGITTTPLQLAVAYASIANGGDVMRPRIIAALKYPDGTRAATEPKVIRRSISRRAASLVSGMLVRVVEDGHGKRAGVPGYFVAGKTGTAQVAGSDGKYLTDAHIGSFAGFAPVDDPAFVMVVRIDRPKDTDWAEASAAPLFGDIASFLLHYLQIPPERPIP